MGMRRETHTDAVADAQETELKLEGISLTAAPKIDGIVIGTLEAFGPAGEPLVYYPGTEGQLPALATVALSAGDLGRRVALMFQGGAPDKPVVLGCIQEPNRALAEAARVEVDGRKLVLEGRDEVELRCGKASIKLTRAGKIIIKGAHLVSRSSGANKIKGATVNIN